MKKIKFNDSSNFINKIKQIIKPLRLDLLGSNQDSNKGFDSTLSILEKKIRKYIKGSYLFLESKTIDSDNGFIIIINLYRSEKILESFSPIQIKLFSSSTDFYRNFCPLEKLNSIKEFHNVVDLIDYVDEEKIDEGYRYPFYIQEKVLDFREIALALIKEYYQNSEIQFDQIMIYMKEIFINLFKSFFRTIFVLYLKNDQINTKFGIKNFGIKYPIPKRLLNLSNISHFNRFYCSSFSGSVSKSFYPITDSKIYDRRYLYLSFENFRKDLLIQLNNIKGELYSKGMESMLLIQCVIMLKNFYRKFDDKMADIFLSDKISEIGGIKVGDFKVFKFLNYDDIIKNVRNLI